MIQFPGTNFHDLNLDWMLQQIKTMISEWQEMQTDFTTLQGNFNGLQGNFNTLEAEWEAERAWMHNYVQTNMPTEVQEAFDAFIETPAFAQMITDDLSDELITSVIESWLEDNIAQETGYVLDTSLTLSNAAAPAKTVGDALANVINNDFFEPWQVLYKKYFDTDSADNRFSVHGNVLEFTTASSASVTLFTVLSGEFRWRQAAIGTMVPLVTELVPISAYSPSVKGTMVFTFDGESLTRMPRLFVKYCTYDGETVTVLSYNVMPATNVAENKIAEYVFTPTEGTTHLAFGVYFGSGYNVGTYTVGVKFEPFDTPVASLTMSPQSISDDRGELIREVIRPDVVEDRQEDSTEETPEEDAELNES